MKLIVAGSRSIDDYDLITKRISSILLKECPNNKVTHLISGRASGPDKIGEYWASLIGVPIIYMPADWDQYKKAAGSIRNAEMAKICDFAIIFWDGKSKGTQNMIFNMKKVNKPYIVEVIYND